MIDGADTTLNKLEGLQVNAKNRPLEAVHLNSVTIHANPLATRP